MNAAHHAISLTRTALTSQVLPVILLLLTGFIPAGRTESSDAPPAGSSARRPQSERELRYWLENMIVFHSHPMTG